MARLQMVYYNSHLHMHMKNLQQTNLEIFRQNIEKISFNEGLSTD